MELGLNDLKVLFFNKTSIKRVSTREIYNFLAGFLLLVSSIVYSFTEPNFLGTQKYSFVYDFIINIALELLFMVSLHFILKLFHQKVKLETLFRVIGFTSVLSIFLLLGITPFITQVITILLSIWELLLIGYILKQLTKTSYWRLAVILILSLLGLLLLGFLLIMLIAFVSLWLGIPIEYFTPL